MYSANSPPSVLPSTVLGDQFLVSFGKSASVGVFHAIHEWDLSRGDRVVVHTPRGVEPGTVLAPATLRQARLLSSAVSGQLLRPWSPGDEDTLSHLSQNAKALFERCQILMRDRGIPMVPLDCDFLLQPPCVILQFVGNASDAELARLIGDLRAEHPLEIRLENLSLPREAPEPASGCGKPDCGKSEGGGCSTCSTGGGCSSCGSGAVDLRPYFAHLRSEMEQKRRSLN